MKSKGNKKDEDAKKKRWKRIIVHNNIFCRHLMTGCLLASHRIAPHRTALHRIKRTVHIK
jgi:DUF1680 family protein